MAEENFAGGKDQPLRGKVHRHVSGLEGDLDAFKMRPQGGGRVGEPAEGEGVGGEEKAEIVLHEGEGNGADGKNGETQHEGRDADGEDGEAFALGDAMECLFDALEEAGPETRQSKRDCDRDGSEAAFNQHERGRGGWV